MQIPMTVEALVLELVDGETLAERLAKGPLPVDGRSAPRGKKP